MIESHRRSPIGGMITLAFHPLILFFGFTLLLVCLAPNYFGVDSVEQKVPFLIQVFFLTVLMPGLALLMLRLLNLIDQSDELRKDRVIPYVVMSTFYLWFYLNITNQFDVFYQFKVMALGINVLLFLCLFGSVFEKVSFHLAFMAWLLMSAFFVLSYIKTNYLFDSHAQTIAPSAIFAIFATLCGISLLLSIAVSPRYSSRQLLLSVMLGVLAYGLAVNLY